MNRQDLINELESRYKPNQPQQLHLGLHAVEGLFAAFAQLAQLGLQFSLTELAPADVAGDEFPKMLYGAKDAAGNLMHKIVGSVEEEAKALEEGFEVHPSMKPPVEAEATKAE